MVWREREREKENDKKYKEWPVGIAVENVKMINICENDKDRGTGKKINKLQKMLLKIEVLIY